MKTYSKQEIRTILDNHKKWLQDDPEGEKADLSFANLRSADLSSADLRYADLCSANLSFTDLRSADLSSADLRSTDLSYADLRSTNLGSADLSSAKNLLETWDFLEDFEYDNKGLICFKRLGRTEYDAPSHWKIEPGAILTEVVNPLRTIGCGCGVNVGSLKWCANHYMAADLWKVRIPIKALASVVIPYNTDGKFRCGMIELIEIVDTHGKKKEVVR